MQWILWTAVSTTAETCGSRWPNTADPTTIVSADASDPGLGRPDAALAAADDPAHAAAGDPAQTAAGDPAQTAAGDPDRAAPDVAADQNLGIGRVPSLRERSRVPSRGPGPGRSPAKGLHPRVGIDPSRGHAGSSQKRPAAPSQGPGAAATATKNDKNDLFRHANIF